MLLNLKQENYLTIGNLDVDFREKFVVVTGESGSGKSILLSGITASLGGKISLDCISSGCDSASITTVFDISNNEKAREFLKDYDFIEDEDDNELILRVVVDKNNRKRYFINSNVTKQKVVKDLSEHLINYFGQNHKLKLADKKYQESFVDLYANEFLGSNVHFTTIDKMKEVYRKIQENNSIINESRDTSLVNGSGTLSLLEYQVNELESVQLNKEYIYSLRDKLAKLDDFRRCSEAVYQSSAIVGGNDDTGSIRDSIGRVKSIFAGISQKDDVGDEFLAFQESINEKIILIGELADEFVSLCDNWQEDNESDFSIETYNELQEEYRKIEEISGKHNVPIDTLEERLEELNAQLKEIRSKIKTDVEIEEIMNENKVLKDEYLKLAIEVSDNRKKASEAFIDEANEKLSTLGFINDKSLTINIDKRDPKCDVHSEVQFSESGIDSIEFMLQPNLGQDAKPLAQIASGGELSRVSLVFESIIGQESSQVMIFDEIDSGVSSNISLGMAKLLKEISRNNQVFSITHSAHIASFAEQHIYVSKGNSKVDGEFVTKTRVKELKTDNTINKEIARMVVGDANIINSETYNLVKKMRSGHYVDLPE